MNNVKSSSGISTQLSQGNAALRRKNYKAAIAHYQNALIESPNLNTAILANLRIATDRYARETGLPTPESYAELRTNAQAITFDSFYYLESNKDVREAKMNAEEHYYGFGEAEGRKPNPFFDPDFYLRVNADVRAAGMSAFEHYRNHGHHEGRRGARRVHDRASSKNIKPLLFVGHDGIQAGSEVVLLEVIKWFYNHTTRRIKLLLLSPGPMASKYTDFAETYVLPGYVDNEDAFSNFISEDFEFTYLNTVVSGGFFTIIEDLGLKVKGEVVTHIHEMQKVIETYPKEMSNLLANTNLWLSASPRSTKALTQTYKIPDSKISTVPAFINPINQINNFISFKSEAKAALGIAESEFVVVGCGTVYPRKGADLFVETARHLKSKTDIAFKFVWIGDGPDLGKILSTLTPAEHEFISFVGNRPDANKMLACGDIFYMCSREDPFPLVVLEAAQHKIPSICFRPATGIVEFIEKDAGFTLEKINTMDAASIIFKLLNNKEIISNAGQKAYEKLYALYTSDKQATKIFESIKHLTNYIPAVSAIVPFYNHKNYIEERIKSITEQSIKDLEILILDYASTDGTKSKLSKICKKGKLRLVLNQKNSGSPFIQWSKGVRLAKADIVWFAEGDDTCDRDFIKVLLPAFNDSLVNISAAKTIMIDETGALKHHALDPYLNQAYQGKFDTSYKSDGFHEVNQQFGAVCTLVNASGLLIKKSSFGNSLESAQSYKMAGDWHIYLDCLKSGKLSYNVKTTNYFRRHSQSQIHKLEGSEQYFRERARITKHVASNYYTDAKFIKKAFSVIDEEWARFSHNHPENSLEDFYPKSEIASTALKRTHSKHAAFYVHGMLFSKGGIERIAAQLANHLVSKGWNITIYCKKSDSLEAVYPLYESVKIIPCFDDQELDTSVAYLRKSLLDSNVDVFVPMLSEWLFNPIVQAGRSTGIPIIASEHNDPWKIQELWWTESERIACFEKVDAIHLLLNRYNDSLPNHLIGKAHIIPNGVDLPAKQSGRRRNVIISVGRLEPQKRFDHLIMAVASVSDQLRRASYTVEIYGEGQLKSEIASLIKEKSLEDIIFLKGKTNTIEEVYKTAKCFALASDFEGLPLTLLEALSYSVPAVAFQTCNGPNEIINDGINGRLVDSISEFGEALLQIINEDNHLNFAEAARSRAMDYSLKDVYAQWEKLLESYTTEEFISN